ncbi:MAG TPA: WS/DGAT domain-containing protein, partial [Candidatus Kryptonia bacterium]|nr:WS/DGAT domain-containing protein [Candidatus Kryptonia bacterium]
LIEGLRGGAAAYFLKLHHSVMDGGGALALFDAMTQARRSDPIRPLRRTRARRKSISMPEQAAVLARESVQGALTAVSGAAEAVMQALRDPSATLAELAATAGRVRTMFNDITAPPISDPLAARCTGIGRRVDGVTLSLARLRRLKEALGISLNDLVLTAVTGAVARYHEHRGLFLEEVNCIVPMNLRQDHERHALGNRVGAFSVRLPVGEPDALRRVERIHQQTRSAKSNRQGGTYKTLLQAVAIVPNVGFRALARQAAGRVHLICSNVPGPPTQRYLGGAKIEAVYPFAPVMLGTPLSIALVSYGDSYAVGIDTDPAAIPDPERLRRYLEEEINDIERQVAPRPHPRRRVAEATAETTAAAESTHANGGAPLQM